MKILATVLGLITLLTSGLSIVNTLILPNLSEPDLYGSGGILNIEFGLVNLQRIDDDLDQYWTVTGEPGATAVAKHAGFTQNFGFIDSENSFSSILYVPYMNAQSGSSTTPVTGDTIRFGLTRGDMLERVTNLCLALYHQIMVFVAGFSVLLQKIIW